jgi:hypothetical protein
VPERVWLRVGLALLALMLATALVSLRRGASRERAWLNGIGALLLLLTGAIASIYWTHPGWLDIAIGISAPFAGLLFSVIAAARGVRLAGWGAAVFSISCAGLVWWCSPLLNRALAAALN